MSLLNTDALPHKPIKCLTNSSNITKNVWDLVEPELEMFEKISILFLISAEYTGTYQKILGLFESVSNIIAEFVKSNFDSWSEKIMEALCVIDNREVLRNLGFDPSDIVQKYYQNISRCTVTIHPASKVLYKLFETMDKKKVELLLRYVYEEDGKENVLPDNYNLELHALYWLHAKYITISPDGNGDLSMLLKHLKRMDYHGTLIYQDVEHYSMKSNLISHRSFEKPLSNGSPKVHNENNISSGKEERDLVEKYTVKKGKCVIINEENFSRMAKTQFEKRDGTRKDGQMLRAAFTGLAFDVEEHFDLTEKQIFSELKKVSLNFDKKIHDCLVVTVLSHGCEGSIVSSDGHEIPVKVVEDAVCTEALQDVIKILIIQACQGTTTGDVSQNSGLTFDGPSKSGRKCENILRFANFAKFMSTMEGFNSIRHKENGSWFVQAICEVFTNSQSISLSQWHIGVTKKVRSKVGCVNDCPNASQMPVFSSRLEVDVYFPASNEELRTNDKERHER